ncbi:hypothetical protein DPMN_016872 [Dreissena polymorpha]|uniref:Uncharacterized protein n=1 Tax=Dreissena polymorpha TaxID=45954 RepID=A0A9D4NFL1_DREPO|nr:hypothetical protein DPMN_016872 [Dreissena polymorpha]
MTIMDVLLTPGRPARTGIIRSPHYFPVPPLLKPVNSPAGSPGQAGLATVYPGQAPVVAGSAPVKAGSRPGIARLSPQRCGRAPVYRNTALHSPATATPRFHPVVAGNAPAEPR